MRNLDARSQARANETELHGSTAAIGGGNLADVSIRARIEARRGVVTMPRQSGP